MKAYLLKLLICHFSVCLSLSLSLSFIKQLSPPLHVSSYDRLKRGCWKKFGENHPVSVEVNVVIKLELFFFSFDHLLKVC